MNKKFSNYTKYFWLVFFICYFLLSNIKAQIFEGTYTGTFSGSIIKEYDGGKTKITTTPKQITFIVSTKNGLQIDGEIVGEWEYLGEMYGKPSIEKKDWSKPLMICRTDLADASALSKVKSLNFSCQGHAYLDVITLTGTIRERVISGKWQVRDITNATGTFQAANSNHSPISTKIGSGVRFGGVSGQVEVWHEDETENDSKIAKIDTVLYEGDHIKTAEDATCIISFADMSTFVMKPESEIILAKTNESESKLKLVFGNIIANVKKIIKDGSMEVDCDQAVAGIKGTKFELWELGQKIGTTLRVEEGTVEFRHKTSGKIIMVSSGQIVSATPSGFVSGQINPTPIEKELFFNGNDYGVANGGQIPTFNLPSAANITFIMTYHWNSGRGAEAGTITLVGENGKQYGPWQVTVNNKVYWEVRPNITLPAGRYKVIDSDPTTWAQNSGSSGYGMVRIRGIEIK
ncbi:MAG: FecR domain-containing protein [Pyrinomonadaceae bacterium]|nr:FecR domain-containing protein [Pyrinomonadaceae bacterium]